MNVPVDIARISTDLLGWRNLDFTEQLEIKSVEQLKLNCKFDAVSEELDDLRKRGALEMTNIQSKMQLKLSQLESDHAKQLDAKQKSSAQLFADFKNSQSKVSEQELKFNQMLNEKNGLESLLDKSSRQCTDLTQKLVETTKAVELVTKKLATRAELRGRIGSGRREAHEQDPPRTRADTIPSRSTAVIKQITARVV